MGKFINWIKENKSYDFINPSENLAREIKMFLSDRAITTRELSRTGNSQEVEVGSPIKTLHVSAKYFTGAGDGVYYIDGYDNSGFYNKSDLFQTIRKLLT